MSMTVYGAKTLSAFQDIVRGYDTVVHKDVASRHGFSLQFKDGLNRCQALLGPFDNDLRSTSTN